MSNKRVVITGLGVVSPIGCDLDTLWTNLTEGKSGITPIAQMPTNSLPVKSGAECKSFTGDIEDYGQLDKLAQRAIKKNMKVMCRRSKWGRCCRSEGTPSQRPGRITRSGAMWLLVRL